LFIVRSITLQWSLKVEFFGFMLLNATNRTENLRSRPVYLSATLVDSPVFAAPECFWRIYVAQSFCSQRRRGIGPSSGQKHRCTFAHTESHWLGETSFVACFRPHGAREGYRARRLYSAHRSDLGTQTCRLAPYGRMQVAIRSAVTDSPFLRSIKRRLTSL
jgi:hypothetical protein